MESQEREQIEKLARVETIALATQEDVRELKNIIMSSGQQIVGRGEWVQRNDLVDQRFRDVGREVSNLRTKHEADITAINAQKTPWYQVAAVIVAALGVVAAFIAIYANIK